MPHPAPSCGLNALPTRVTDPSLRVSSRSSACHQVHEAIFPKPLQMGMLQASDAPSPLPLGMPPSAIAADMLSRLVLRPLTKKGLDRSEEELLLRWQDSQGSWNTLAESELRWELTQTPRLLQILRTLPAGLQLPEGSWQYDLRQLGIPKKSAPSQPAESAPAIEEVPSPRAEEVGKEEPNRPAEGNDEEGAQAAGQAEEQQAQEAQAAGVDGDAAPMEAEAEEGKAEDAAKPDAAQPSPTVSRRRLILQSLILPTTARLSATTSKRPSAPHMSRPSPRRVQRPRSCPPRAPASPFSEPAPPARRVPQRLGGAASARPTACRTRHPATGGVLLF